MPESKVVYVTSAQKAAAQTMVRRREATGRFVSPEARKIAEARTVRITPRSSSASAK
jgi:hypothetical protein